MLGRRSERASGGSVPGAGVALALLCALPLAGCSGGGEGGGERLSRVEAARLTAVADAYLQLRADAVTETARDADPLPAPARLTPAFARRTARDLGRLAKTGRSLERVDGGYGRAQVDTVPKAAARRGDTVTLKAEEHAALHPPAAEARVGAPVEEYVEPHTFTFTRTATGDWLLSADRTRAGSWLPPVTQVRRGR